MLALYHELAGGRENQKGGLRVAIPCVKTYKLSLSKLQERVGPQSRVPDHVMLSFVYLYAVYKLT